VGLPEAHWLDEARNILMEHPGLAPASTRVAVKRELASVVPSELV
jgi:hypothetical protein